MIAGASSRDDTVASYRVTMTQAFRSTILFYALFAGAIALGVAYNAARISLSENARDLATLEVLGFTHGEILQIQLGELVLLALVSIPIGVVLGWALANGVSLAYGRDEMRIPATVTPRAIGFAVLVFAAAVAATALLIARRVTRLNLVTVLKTRE
jgi:putative ABC transport system permease protein